MRYLAAIMVISAMLMTVGCVSPESKSSTLFELSKDETRIYESLKQDSDVSLLHGVDPLTIAKLYVLSLYESSYDVTYELYTQREGYVAWTKEEDQQIPIEHRGTKEKIKDIYNNIEDGRFVQTSDYEGYIEYEAEKGEKSYFGMIQDENGIWKVSFMPIQ